MFSFPTRSALRATAIATLIFASVWFVVQTQPEARVGPLVALGLGVAAWLASAVVKPDRAAAASAGSEDRAWRNRQRLIGSVRSVWVEGVFESSLRGATPITLNLVSRPDLVQPGQAHGTLPDGARARGRLLIVGEPGSGKTMELYSENAPSPRPRGRVSRQRPVQGTASTL